MAERRQRLMSFRSASILHHVNHVTVCVVINHHFRRIITSCKRYSTTKVTVTEIAKVRRQTHQSKKNLTVTDLGKDPKMARILLLFNFFLVATKINAYQAGHSKLSKSQCVSTERDDVIMIQEINPARDSLIACEDEVSNRRLFLGSLAATSLLIASPKEAQAKDDRKNALEISTESISAADTSAVDWNAIFQKASKKALGGGKAGASAAVVQVLSLMWLRTSMNYQYRYGGNLQSSLQTLWDEGGIPRLYQGLPFALIQGPMTRFGDTAANVGILALLEATPETQSLPLPIKTAIGSISAGLWRIVLMPVDASKTAMQVEGADGLKNLWGLAAWATAPW